jgi:putative acetyltransferase
VTYAIREETPSDADGVRAVHDAAFGRRNEGALVDALRNANLIAVSIVAKSNDGAILANAVFSRLSVQTAADPISALALAPVGVTPAYQSRGIGTHIIRHGLDLCAQRDYDAVLVLGDPRYYTRFGFSPELAQRIKSPYSAFGHHWMALALRQRTLPKCEVTYPPAFETVD